jgi:hypothetical protein
MLAALCVGLWVAIDRWQLQPHPEFVPSGFVLLAWYALAVLALAALLRRHSRPAPDFTAVCALVVGLVPPLLVIASLAAATLDDRFVWAERAALALYAALYVARGLRALSGRSQVAASALACLFVGAFVWASDALDAIPDVWGTSAAVPNAPDAPDAPEAPGACAGRCGRSPSGRIRRRRNAARRRRSLAVRTAGAHRCGARAGAARSGGAVRRVFPGVRRRRRATGVCR